MEVSSLSPLLPGAVRPQGPEPQNARASATTDFNSFLTLLTAQLRNQDPLSPLDSTEFIAQLASFSSVEQLVAANERLDAFAEQALAGDIASLSSWIGRNVAVADGQFRATGTPIVFEVPQREAGSRIEAVIRDTDGREIRRMDVSEAASGTTSWDGRDGAGAVVHPGDLTLSFAFFEGGTLTSEVAGVVLRRVDGLRGTDEGLVLELRDGGLVALESVTRVTETS